MYSLDSFIQETAKALADPRNLDQRIGQLYMNLLAERRNDLYQRITNTHIDPFYNDQHVTEFWSFLRDNW